MTLEEISDRELRKWCVEKSLDFFNRNVSGQQITTLAEHFFQYIKYGGDTEYDVEDDPTPPVNMSPGIAVLRGLASMPDDGFHMS